KSPSPSEDLLVWTWVIDQPPKAGEARRQRTEAKAIDRDMGVSWQTCKRSLPGRAVQVARDAERHADRGESGEHRTHHDDSAVGLNLHRLDARSDAAG